MVKMKSESSRLHQISLWDQNSLHRAAANLMDTCVELHQSATRLRENSIPVSWLGEASEHASYRRDQLSQLFLDQLHKMRVAAETLEQIAPTVGKLAAEAKAILSIMSMEDIAIQGLVVTDRRGVQHFQSSAEALAYTNSRNKIVSQIAQRVSTLDVNASHCESTIQAGFVQDDRRGARRDALRATGGRRGGGGEMGPLAPPVARRQTRESAPPWLAHIH